MLLAPQEWASQQIHHVVLRKSATNYISDSTGLRMLNVKAHDSTDTIIAHLVKLVTHIPKATTGVLGLSLPQTMSCMSFPPDVSVLSYLLCPVK